MKVSAFTFCHNILESGLPLLESVEAVRDYVDEIVVVDMQSTDQTPELLKRLGVKILQSPWPWPDNPRDTLNHAFELHQECQYDTVIFFEADEVYDDRLLQAIRWKIAQGQNNLAVWRLQLEGNFQKCRWYPIPVHRVFPKGKGTYIEHPTNCCQNETVILPPDTGFLWDISNCFRGNIGGRRKGHSEIFGTPRRLFVPGHFTEPVEVSEEEERELLEHPYWEWTETPFNIPGVLRRLLGVTDYRQSQGVKILLGEGV